MTPNCQLLLRGTEHLGLLENGVAEGRRLLQLKGVRRMCVVAMGWLRVFPKSNLGLLMRLGWLKAPGGSYMHSTALH